LLSLNCIFSLVYLSTLGSYPVHGLCNEYVFGMLHVKRAMLHLRREKVADKNNRKSVKLIDKTSHQEMVNGVLLTF
jgi:hypothetical protein